MNSKRKTAHPLTLVLPPLFLLAVFLWTSIHGLNFGVHWDEPRAKFDAIRNTLNTGVFLQAAGEPSGHQYNYGGVNYLLTWAGFTPEMLKYIREGPLTREALSEAITPLLYGLPVRLRVRGIYLALCSLSILWLFCLNLILGRSRAEAFLAAAILTCSWEFAYHSRWIAPDGIMMQFVLLAFLCLAIGSTRKATHWFYLGAVAAGLATGTKYTGALIAPFFLLGAGYSVWQERRSLFQVWKQGIGLVGTIVLTFAITSPGVLIDPFRFFHELRTQRGIYAAGWYGYTVKPGIEHVLRILEYLSIQVFSHFWTISAVLAVFCLLGFVFLLLERRMFAFVVTGFSVVYLAYFSQQAAMIVRNLLAVVPFLCMAAARGISVMGERLSPRGRLVLYALVGMLLAVNLGWEVYAADQIRKRANSEYFLKKFAAYVQSSPQDIYFASTKLVAAFRAAALAVPGNVVTDPAAQYTKVAFFQTESADILWRNWPSNSWGMYEKTFGPLEVNLEAYSTFIGNQRIILVTRQRYKDLPLKDKDMLTP